MGGHRQRTVLKEPAHTHHTRPGPTQGARPRAYLIDTPHNRFVRQPLTGRVFRNVASTMHNVVHLTAVEASPTRNNDATHSGPTRRAHAAPVPSRSTHD